MESVEGRRSRDQQRCLHGDSHGKSNVKRSTNQEGYGKRFYNMIGMDDSWWSGGRGVFHGPRKIQRSLRDFNRSKQRALWSRFLGSMATNPVVGSRFVEYGGGGRWEMVETNYFWLRNRQHNLRKLTEQHGWRNVFGCTSMQYMYVRRDVYFMHVYVGLYM